MTQLPFRSATELAAAVRGKEISSAELVECYLARIAALDRAWGGGHARRGADRDRC